MNLAPHSGAQDSKIVSPKSTDGVWGDEGGQNGDENYRVDRCLAREESDVDPVDNYPETARAMSVEPLNTREIDGTVLQQEATGKNYRRPQDRYAEKAREVGWGASVSGVLREWEGCDTITEFTLLYENDPGASSRMGSWRQGFGRTDRI